MVYIKHSEAIDDKIVVIEINGALNSETSAGFEEYIDQLLESKKTFIIIDADNLEYVSSVGIGAILYTQKKIMANNGFIIICNLSDEIISLYELLGFDKVFELTDSKEEALQIMEKQLELRSDTLNDQPEEVPVLGEDIDNSFMKEGPDIDEPIGYDVHIEGDDEESDFESPIIMECPECKCMIRIKNIGSYICPDCNAEFSVDEDQTIKFS